MDRVNIIMNLICRKKGGSEKPLLILFDFKNLGKYLFLQLSAAMQLFMNIPKLFIGNMRINLRSGDIPVP